MRLLFDCPRQAGLAAAAAREGHAVRVRAGTPWFDAVLGWRPDLVLVSPAAAAGPEFRACLAAEGFAHRVADPAPAADCPPDWAGGTFRAGMACAVAVVGDCGPNALPLLRKLAAAGVDLKVFGAGYGGLPQCLGPVSPAGAADARRSARAVFDPDDCPWRRADAVAAGGAWLADRLPDSAAPDWADLVRDWTRRPTASEAARRDFLARHTFHPRLAELLAC